MRPHVRFRALALAVLAFSALVASACASSMTTQRAAQVPTATHASIATPTPAPSPVNAYLGAGDTVYALDGRTGARLWTYDAGQNSGVGGVEDVHLLDGNVVFANEGDQSLYALDATTGALRWKVKGASQFDFHPVLTLAALGGVLYVANIGGQVPSATYAIDERAGNVLWHTGGGSMAVGDDAVYLANPIHGSDAEPDTDGIISALNRTDGTRLWQTKGHPFSRLLLGGGVLYATANDTLYAFDPKTGAALWSKQFANFVFVVMLAGNTLYLNDSQRITALDATSQNILWSFPIASDSPAYLAYGDTALCVSNHGHLYDLNPTTGAQLWSKQDANGYTLFQQMNGVCYAGVSATAESPVTAFDAHTGEAHWSAHLPKFFSALIPTSNAIYVLSSPGGNFRGAAVNVFSTTDGSPLWQFDANTQFPGSLAVG